MGYDEYTARDIVRVSMPPIENLSSGGFRRKWVLELRGVQPTPAVVGELQSRLTATLGMSVELTIDGSPGADDHWQLALATITEVDPWEHRILFSTYDAMRSIDRELGYVFSVEGQPRKNWRPFRHAR